MRRVLEVITPSNVMLFGAALLVVSIIFSPFLLSISMWMLVAAGLGEAALVDMKKNGRSRWSPAGMLKQAFVTWLSSPVYRMFGLLFLVVVLSGLWSSELDFWLVRSRVRIPFVVLPLAFANFPIQRPFAYKSIIYLMFWVLFMTNIGVMINFALHYDTLMEGLLKGQTIPVPRNHIRFSLMSCTAVLLGGWLWADGFRLKFNWERNVLAVAVLLQLLMVHVLAVRSGLVALYAALLLTAVWMVAKMKNRWVGAALFIAVAAMAVSAVKYVPSLSHKLGYMRYDWEVFLQGKGSEYSDAQRWISLEAGVALWQSHPFLGVGTGDLPAETAGYMQARYPEFAAHPKLPHNQFVYILAATGLFGMAMSALALFTPWIIGAHRKLYPFWVVQTAVMVSFMVEYTLETAIGAAFYLFYTLWFIQLGQSEYA